MPPSMFRPAAKPLSGRYLSFAAREEIALLLVQGHSLQEIGRLLGRSASTIARIITTLPQELHRSLTWDQGAEMAQHARLKIDTGVQVCFCDPQSPCLSPASAGTLNQR